MAYAYQARSKAGQIETGFLEAASLAAARQQLKGRGLFPLSVTEHRSMVRNVARRSGRVSKNDLMMMTTQLSIMQKSGTDLAESLKSVARQVTNKRLAEAMRQVVRDIEDGKSFSVALGSQAEVFGEAYVSGIAAGEASGTLGQVLSRLTVLLRNEVRLVNTIRGIITYPAILMLVAFFVINALVFFVLPQFAKVFEDLGKVPPPTTQFLLSFGAFVSGNLLAVAVGVVLTIVGLVVMSRTQWFRSWLDRSLLNMPGIGKATRTLLAGRTFRLIGTMIQSGVPLLDAVCLSRRSVRNSEYTRLFDEIETQLTKGNGLSTALSTVDFLPDGLAQMISTAEASGDLGSVMEIVGEHYEDEAERHVRELSKVLEPLIIVLMGGIVSVVVMSVILPLLDMSSTTGA